MARKREQIPEGVANIRNVTEQWKNHCSDPAHYELWLYDTHVGFCLEDRERNGYNDSDFYMVVWNPETNKPESIEFASTRGWSYPCLASHVDASEEVRAKYDAYKVALSFLWPSGNRGRAVAAQKKGDKTAKREQPNRIPNPKQMLNLVAKLVQGVQDDIFNEEFKHVEVDRATMVKLAGMVGITADGRGK
jgi:hypothetical protein